MTIIQPITNNYIYYILMTNNNYNLTSIHLIMFIYALYYYKPKYKLEYNKYIEICDYDINKIMEFYIIKVNKNYLENYIKYKESLHGTFKFFKRNDFLCCIYISHDRRDFYVLFRGTIPKKSNIITDINIIPMEIDNCSIVHEGFYNALKDNNFFKEIYKELLKFKNQNPYSKIFIIGHSMGAAYALLTAYLLYEEKKFKHKINLYLYGTPTIGNDCFINKLFKNELLNINIYVNERDIVVHKFCNTFKYYPKYFLYRNNKCLTLSNKFIVWWYLLNNNDVSDHYAVSYHNSIINNDVISIT